jgi:hypothetical protein
MPSVEIIKMVEDITCTHMACRLRLAKLDWPGYQNCASTPAADASPWASRHHHHHFPTPSHLAGEVNVRAEYGQSADYSINDALWACSNVFADVTSKVASRRIFLFTNNDQPHATRPDLEVHFRFDISLSDTVLPP